MTDVWMPPPAALDVATIPPCGMWMLETDACCPPPKRTGPCPPAVTTCCEPTIEELIRYAVAVICAVTGHNWTGWCPKVDELCFPGGCGCTGGCAKCCDRDDLPIGDGVWPILHGSVGVRRGDPDTGDIIPAALWRLDQNGYLTHLGTGWPRCEKLYVHYREIRVPLGGPEACRRLVCELVKLWHPDVTACGIKTVTAEQVVAGEIPEGLFSDVFLAGLIAAWAPVAGAGSGRVRSFGPLGGWQRTTIRGL